MNFLNDYDEVDEEELRWLLHEIMKTQALRKSKYYINTGSFRHHNNCGSTQPSIAASKENKLVVYRAYEGSNQSEHEKDNRGIVLEVHVTH